MRPTQYYVTHVVYTIAIVSQINQYNTYESNYKTHTLLTITCLYPTAIKCPSIDSMLSENMVWRLISGSLNELAAQIMLSCIPGYYLGGRRTLRCLTNATWEGLEEKLSCKSKYTQLEQASTQFITYWLKLKWNTDYEQCMKEVHRISWIKTLNMQNANNANYNIIEYSFSPLCFYKQLLNVLLFDLIVLI